jgi:hypothetical protein
MKFTVLNSHIRLLVEAQIGIHFGFHPEPGNGQELPVPDAFHHYRLFTFENSRGVEGTGIKCRLVNGNWINI